MARQIDQCPEKPNSNEKERTFRIRVVTPLFGGGAESRRLDPITPIRVSSIRGNLRFWWRAGRGSRYETAEQLREREKEIFGLSSVSSRLNVKVDMLCPGTVCKFSSLHLPEYVTFPFKEDKAAGPIQVLKDAEFNLTLQYPADIECDVLSAVWAWVNFGGLGARTRRGCGALFCDELSPRNVRSPSEINKWYRDQLKKYGIIPAKTPRLWPTLPDRIWTGPLHDKRKELDANMMDAWRDVILKYKTFRSKGYGISWTEKKSIQRILNSAEAETDAFSPSFPRAELGLPIVFHFTKENLPDTVLLPANSYRSQRMASPLILKPMAIQNQTLSAMPVVLKLVTPRLKEAQLKLLKDHKDHEPLFHASESHIRPSRHDRNGSVSALDQFMSFIEKKGGYQAR
jgi:CRISPR-associated protein Cmr1